MIGRAGQTSAEGATAPGNSQAKGPICYKCSGEKCAAFAEGITISGKRTEWHHPLGV